VGAHWLFSVSMPAGFVWRQARSFSAKRTCCSDKRTLDEPNEGVFSASHWLGAQKTGHAGKARGIVPSPAKPSRVTHLCPQLSGAPSGTAVVRLSYWLPSLTPFVNGKSLIQTTRSCWGSPMAGTWHACKLAELTTLSAVGGRHSWGDFPHCRRALRELLLNNAISKKYKFDFSKLPFRAAGGATCWF